MLTLQARKNKVDLNDYDYRRDIQNRLFLAELNSFEIEVINEIVDNSVNTSVERLAKDLKVKEDKLLPTIGKLSSFGLVETEGSKIHVNKEMRKYCETHLEKFDPDFHPTLEYLKELLNKVPIHVLPNWYAISRSSDHIFQSIVEKYMIDPKTYTAYLDELTFDIPELNRIYNEVYASPAFTVTTDSILKKYGLSKEQLAEFILQLEYNLACCHCFVPKEDGELEEVITLFHEWKELLTFQLTTRPPSIQESESIRPTHPEEFGFVLDLTTLSRALRKGPLTLSETADGWLLEEPAAKALFPHFGELAFPEEHQKNLICMATQMQLAVLHGNRLERGPLAEEWEAMNAPNQALAVYRQPSRTHRMLDKRAIPHCDRDIRETEKSLKRIAKSGWVYYRDFLKGFTAQIGSHDPIELKHKGRRWAYALPDYNKEDLLLLEAILFGHLFETGIIRLGYLKDELCLAVTPFGQELLLGE